MESKIRDEEWILSLLPFLIGGMNYVSTNNYIISILPIGRAYKNEWEMKTMSRFWYWVVKTIRSNKYCNKCCLICEYYEECKRDIGL